LGSTPGPTSATASSSAAARMPAAPQGQGQGQEQEQEQEQPSTAAPTTIAVAPPKKKPDPKPTPEPTGVEGILSRTSSNIAPKTTSDNATATADGNSAPSTNTSTAPPPKPPLIGMKLSSLLKTIDPSGVFELDVNAEEQLIALANDFASSLIKKSMRVAKHRHLKKQYKYANNGNGNGNAGSSNSVVEVHDVSIVLKKNWGITIPGLSTTSATSNSSRSGRGRNILNAGKILGLSAPDPTKVSKQPLQQRQQQHPQKPLPQSAELALTANGKRKRPIDSEGDDVSGSGTGPLLKKN